MIKIIVKEPGVMPEIVEVEGMSEINKIIGNVDEQGNGWNYANSDTRMPIGPYIDEYCKADAMFNVNFEGNLWDDFDNGVLCGNIIFAGWDSSQGKICSLTDDQIKFCFDYIVSKEVN